MEDERGRAPAGSSPAVSDRYQRRERLGSGGFGVVWRAHDNLLRRDVALKEISMPAMLDEGEQAAVRARVLREARAAARLSDPGLVAVYDVAEEDGRPVIVMELVDAPTLAELVADEGPLDHDRAAAIGARVLGALTTAHDRGVIHRDVKPANVMVHPSGRVQLADFGVASVTDDPRVTGSGRMAGSPSYMSPEQAEGREPSPATDLWGLGATLYFAVEGRAPFGKDTAIATLTSVVTEEPRPMVNRGPLTPLIRDMLAKDPQDRPAPDEVRRRLGQAATTPSAVGTRPATPPAPQDTQPETQPGTGPETQPDTQSGTQPHTQPETRPDMRVVAGGDTQVDIRPGPRPEPPRPPRRRPPPRTVRHARAGPPARRRRPVGGIVAIVLVIVAALVAVAAVLQNSGRKGGGRDSTSPSTGGSGGGAASAPANWVSYRDPSTGFTISRPPGWSVSTRGTLTDFSDPASGAYLRVDHQQPPGPSPEGAWKTLEASFSRQYGGYERIRLTPTSYKGYDAAVWEFAYNDGGARLRAVDLGFIAGSYGFALNFQTHIEDWERFQPVFDSFKASFQAPS